MILGVPSTPNGVLARAEELVRERRAAAVEDLELILAWADLHGEEPEIHVAGAESLTVLGGDGTPPVRDLCLAELAIARQASVPATRSAMADALDLRHRLPKTWLPKTWLPKTWLAVRALHL